MEEKKIGYKDVFSQKEYCKLIVANLISRFGDSIDAIAFTWLIYQVTGSAAWSAIIFAVNQLPSVIVQPFAGALVENMNKKKLMVITDLIRAAVVVCLALALMKDMVTPAFLVIFCIIISTVEAFRMPAGIAVIPKLIDEEYYAHATGLNSTLSTIVQLIGMGAGGVIIGVIGMSAAIAIDAATFLFSGLIIMLIRIKEEKTEKKEINVKGYFETLKAGIAYIKTQPVIRNFVIMGALVNAVIVPINALQSPLASEVLGQGSTLLSVFGIAIVLGMGIGSFVYPMLGKKIKTLNIICTCGTAIGAAMAAYTIGSLFKQHVIAIYLFTAALSVLIGFAASMFSSCVSVQFMKAVEPDYLARVGAIFNAVACAATPVASFAISASLGVVSTANLLILGGALCVIIFMVIAIKKVRFE